VIEQWLNVIVGVLALGIVGSVWALIRHARRKGPLSVEPEHAPSPPTTNESAWRAWNRSR